MRDVARSLSRSVSTLSEELRRNRVKGAYDPRKAHHKAYVRRKYAKYQGMKIVGHASLFAFVKDKLREGRSPASIEGRIKSHEKALPVVSADSIERFLKSVYGRSLQAQRQRQKRLRSRRRRRKKHAKLKDRKFIELRPPIAGRRGRVGDAEADFIVSGKEGTGVLLTMADRRIRVSFLEKILPVSIENVHRGFMRIKERYPELRTITTDNDLLLKKHKELEKLLSSKIYFCHAYHSWEKGTIENVNGEVRKYISKGSDISGCPRGFIRSVEARLNDRYMECLGYATPQEALDSYRRKQKQRRGRNKKKKERCSD
jgi:transposase, IS30 family